MSDNKDTTILETIDSIIDRNDPTQKILMLIATLMDSRLKQISRETSEQYTKLLDKINDVSKDQEDHEGRIGSMEHKKMCPLGIDKSLEKTKEDLTVILFFSEYPKLSVIMLVGLLVLSGFGMERMLTIMKSILAMI